jgi:hypothetical protein
MQAMDGASVQKKYRQLGPYLDELDRRLWAAAEAEHLGYGGVSAVAAATGLSRTTVLAGQRELEQPAPGAGATRRRKPGAGRKRLDSVDPLLLEALEKLVEPETRGDPMRPLRWTCKSTQRLARELTRQRHPISARSVAALLGKMNYSLQANRKVREGRSHPDRDAQFGQINRQIVAFQKRGQPVISIDTKKKELVGQFKNGGREYRPAGQPEEVQVHDFPDPKLGKAIPYGVYDVSANQGWVSVGVDHDTAEFATESVKRWWRMMGQPRYSKAQELLILADGGGSNSSRSRLWKFCLQTLADDLGLKLSVCHFPPATSKWNKIEHRMFCHITQNWRGQPLVSHEVVVQLIGATTTEKGLRIQAEIDPRSYPLKKKISAQQLAEIQITRHDFHGEWNYSIQPRRQSG